MKTSAKVLTCIACLIALLTISCGSPQPAGTESAAHENELIGVWRITEAEIFANPDQGVEAEVFKNHRPGILIFAKSHFAWVDVHGTEPAPDLPEEPTDAQLAAAYNQLTALAGTYEIQGSSITAHIIVSKNPNNMTNNEVFDIEYRFEGDILVFHLKAWNLEFKMKRLE